jgi:Undecaprenyl-phosphate galactose phosphotransferase WbaP
MSRNLDLPSNSLLKSGTQSRKVISQNTFARIFDISLILLAAPYVALAFFIIVILIIADSGGPVLFRQTRIGRYGRKFKLYKFRTMVQNAEEVLQTCLDQSPELKAEWLATHKLKNDPRVSRVGAFLRKTSLDEIPQLWNILIGDMSIIGPRPIVDAEVEKYGSCFGLYKQVRPGLTGLWQVSGRNDISYKRRVALDEYYILNRSFNLDVEIILKTVWVVIGGKGAY